MQPICLPTDNSLRNRNYDKTKPFVAGWGATSFSTIPIFSFNHQFFLFFYFFFFNELMNCYLNVMNRGTFQWDVKRSTNSSGDQTELFRRVQKIPDSRRRRLGHLCRNETRRRRCVSGTHSTKMPIQCHIR